MVLLASQPVLLEQVATQLAPLAQVSELQAQPREQRQERAQELRASLRAQLERERGASPLQARDARTCLRRLRVHRRRRPSLCRFGRRFLGFAIRFGGCLSVCDTFQMMTNFFSNFDGDRAGMSFFLGYAETR